MPTPTPALIAAHPNNTLVQGQNMFVEPPLVITLRLHTGLQTFNFRENPQDFPKLAEPLGRRILGRLSALALDEFILSLHKHGYGFDAVHARAECRPKSRGVISIPFSLGGIALPTSVDDLLRTAIFDTVSIYVDETIRLKTGDKRADTIDCVVREPRDRHKAHYRLTLEAAAFRYRVDPINRF